MLCPMDTHNAAGHAALRRARASEPHRLYHVTIVTAGRQPLFLDFATACAVARLTRLPSLWRGSRALCWVLMPDHLHLLLALGEGDSLPGVMARVKSAMSRQANKVTQRKGAVWQRAYHERALRKDDDAVALARYIIGNPLRAGLVGRIGEYPFWDATWLQPTDTTPL